MMNKQGILIVISGFSGAGKGTLMKSLLAKYNNYALSISATTRKPRLGEVEGKEYFFKTKEEFEQMIEADKLIEYAKYVDNYYGTPKEYVVKQLEQGNDVILEIEIQGALKVKEKYPDALLLFVTPPNALELKRRLLCRGTESLKDIESRMLRAVEESEGIEKYDFIVMNDNLEECVTNLHEIIRSSHCQAFRNINFIQKIRRELKDFSEGDQTCYTHPIQI